MSSKYVDMSLRTSPHFARGVDVEDVMRNVVYALLPLVAASVFCFGLSSLLLIGVTTLTCLLTEHLVCRFSAKSTSIGDYSALITGILLGLVLPPGFPLWMALVGGLVSILLGKAAFGGLGFNVFNPALVGRAFLQAAFPVPITTWSEPFAVDRFVAPISTTLTAPLMKPVSDAVTGATPLSAFKFENSLTGVMELFLGDISGSAGETCAFLIIICGLYLVWRRMLDWRIPSGILLTVVVCSGALHFYNPIYPDPLFMLFSGGLMLGVFFMATDMVTSPVTPLGVWLFAALIGFLTVIIRVFGGLPEGVMYAILLGNAVTPLLNKVTQPRIYGARKKA